MVTNWVQRRGGERDVERRTRQIKEIVRLGTELRADMGLEHILTRIVEGVSSTLGFHVVVLNLLRPGVEQLDIVATAGLTDAERQRLAQDPPTVNALLSVMRPQFCVSHSYFIGHQYKHLLEGVTGVTVYTALPPSAHRSADAWHPEDVFLVPLRSPRDTDRLLGILSLDQPEDGKVPTLDSIDMIELFASQAALAIDTSQLFAEREAERVTIEAQLIELLYHLEQVRQGNLATRVQLHDMALSAMADSLNAVLQALDTLLGDVRGAGEVVSQRAGEMRAAAVALAENAQEQSRQILDVSLAVEGMAHDVARIAGIARDTSGIAHEASDISHVGREAAENAAEGMSAVRELAIQTVKKMKRLGESAQDIGEIVQMVSDFANQTNILALNATIEATRAGEHGRGFAIVAHEIRNLANNSAEATKSIQARVRAIQSDTNGVVITTEHSMQQIVLQSELATQAGAALEAVDSVTRRIAAAIGEMSETATHQAGVAVSVAQEMGSIAQITAHTRDGMTATGASMDQLVELAHSLLRSISVFTLSVAPVTQVGIGVAEPSSPAWPSQPAVALPDAGYPDTGSTTGPLAPDVLTEDWDSSPTHTATPAMPPHLSSPTQPAFPISRPDGDA
ncbi:MAG: methyl-accepting chemotaxis protein [Ktedonobacterales bacterium]